MEPTNVKKTTAQRLEKTTDSLLDKLKAYFIEKGQWDFEANAPTKDKK